MLTNAHFIRVSNEIYTQIILYKAIQLYMNILNCMKAGFMKSLALEKFETRINIHTLKLSIGFLSSRGLYKVNYLNLYMNEPV